jgi:fibronectin type 3 domain-containing protein
MCNLSINIYARVPEKVQMGSESFDGQVTLRWSKRTNATSYILKRADSRQGIYKVVADNIVATDDYKYYVFYKDTGLENAKTYYYKVIAKNDEGLGEESDVHEATPSKSNYLLFRIYGIWGSFDGLDVYDINGNKINYSVCNISDGTGYYNYDLFKCTYNLLNHIRVRFNCKDRELDYVPNTILKLKLEPHCGIKKISIHTSNMSPIKTYVYETIQENTLLNEIKPIGKVDFEVSYYQKEYIIYNSELKAKGEDKKVFLNWKSDNNINNYSIRRSIDKNGPFTTIVSNLKLNEYVDKNLENQRKYYYKLEGYDYNNNIIDLGMVSGTTTKDRFIILEIFEAYEDYYSLLNELEILDSSGNKLDYNLVNRASFDQSYYNPNKCLGEYPYFFNNSKDGKLSEDKYGGVRLEDRLSDDEWARYALILDDNTGVEKINFWTGIDHKPKKMAFYKASSYDYTENLKHRSNDNLSFFAEKNIENNDKITKYEFTQTQPNVPDGIVAISQDNQLKIKWNKVDNADSYQIKRSTSPGGPYTLVEKDIVDLEYIDTGVINGTEYYYVVSAVNKGGESSNSQEVSSIPIAKLPQAPTTLTTIAEKNSIKLSWKAVYNAQNYTVKRSETPGGTYQTIVDNIIDPSYTDTGISFGKTYYYVVTANNAIGVSNNSEEVQGTPGRQKPENPTNIITKVKNNNVYLTWDTSLNAVSYKVLRSESEDGEYKLLRESIKGISYKDSTVEENKTYYYQIIAVNEQGESEETQSVRVVVKHNIEQQALLSITLKNGTTKEYLLTQSQLSEFMDWYEQKTKGKGLPYFTILGKNKYGAYKIVKNYLLFNSISSIDIKEIRQN